MPTSAKSHQHGMLIRITKFLFGIGDSNSMVYEVVAMVEERVVFKKSVTLGPRTSTPARKRPRRNRLHDSDLYVEAPEARNFTKEKLVAQTRTMKKRVPFRFTNRWHGA
ncbi:uncharacterized protein LOC123505616 [Portunus trituberculatus]|uniref:uncharacterized protein LOC123505616 n=1 Tax=Portunus trituberculatus TaxID=210409 RepID=UPI001E1CDEDF|nr:uncharacterized protein LOC123505616 [Portunus trituberculatus]